MSAPAGWYEDPLDPSFSRYWDGSGWTIQRAPRDSSSKSATGPLRDGYSQFKGSNGHPSAEEIQMTEKSQRRAKRPLAILAVGSAVVVASAGIVGAASGAFTSKAATDFDSVEWETLPDWLAEHEAQVTQSTRPDGAALYVATVTDQSVTDSREALISLSYTVEGNGELQSTSEVLSLIEALRPETCGELVGESPDAALDRLLPNGTRVLVVNDDNGQGFGAFLHAIPEGESTPAEQPPQGSANEALVATGTWVPNQTAEGQWFMDPWANNGVEWTSAAVDGLSVVQRRYAPLILAAANESWPATQQGQVCESYRIDEERREDEQRRRLEVERQRKANEQAEQFRLELERRQAEAQQQWTAPAPATPAPVPAPQNNSGGSGNSYQPDTTPYGTPCGPGDRDGDGDGVCNESR